MVLLVSVGAANESWMGDDMLIPATKVSSTVLPITFTAVTLVVEPLILNAVLAMVFCTGVVDSVGAIFVTLNNNAFVGLAVRAAPPVLPMSLIDIPTATLPVYPLVG